VLSDYLQFLEYLQYTPRDIVQFSARTYHRLIALYNAAVFPAQVAALALGAAVAGLALGYPAGWTAQRRGRVAAAILAAAWLVVAWAFHWQRYRAIHLAGGLMAAGFALQALLLAWQAARPGALALAATPDRHARIGAAIVAAALLLYPALPLLLGRDWRAAELFGLAPDPTALATLGLLLALDGRTKPALLVLPTLWCLVTGGTLYALRLAEAPLAPAMALILLGMTLRKNASDGAGRRT